MRDVVLGGRGHASLVVADRGYREAEIAAERRAKLDDEVKAAIAQIERDAAVRRFRRPLSPDQVAAASAEAQVYVAESKRRRKEPGQVARQLAELTQWAASLPPQQPDDPAERDRARRKRDNDYSFGVADVMAAPAQCTHRSCTSSRCHYR